MFEKVWSLKRALNRAAQGQGQGAARFLVMGELNAMGLQFPTNWVAARFAPGM